LTERATNSDESRPAVGGPGRNEGLGPIAQVWTCFHCGEVCADAEAARLHFGSSQHQQPGCQIDLAEYRRMEEVNRRHCEEDTELHRALHRMECEHRTALVRAEEAGYAKELRDAVAAERERWKTEVRQYADNLDAEGESSREVRAFMCLIGLGPNDRTQPAPTAAQEHEDEQF